MASSSLNGETHPYSRGYNFWNTTGAFWRDPSRKFSERSKRYYEEWIKDMRANEKRLIRL